MNLTEEQEIWRPVKNYEGLYEVSNFGRVRSLTRKVKTSKGITQTWIGKMLTPGKSGNGYYYVTLSKNGKSKARRVHILVAQAFLPNKENYQQVNHIDGDKSNNDFSNLEWCTPHQNIKHAVSNGLFNNPIILQFKNGKLVGAFHSTRDAAKATGLPYSAIGKCIQHSPEHKHVGGYVFRKATEIYGRPLNKEEE